MTEQATETKTLAKARFHYDTGLQDQYGIDPQSWKALCESIFPMAKNPGSIVMALSYCKARKLDPFKRTIHIVPVYSKEAGGMIESVWPGIAELRTTAFRTGQYAGRDKTAFGPDVTEKIGNKEVTFPEWCQITVYRVVGGQRVPFPGPTVYWRETYAQFKKDDPTPNTMWARRPRGQIEKCAEAAALRAAFPEELGGELTSDEMHGQIIEGSYDAQTQTWSAADKPTREDKGSDHTLLPLIEFTGEEAGPFPAADWINEFQEQWHQASIEERALLIDSNREIAKEWYAAGEADPMRTWNEYAGTLDLDKEAAAKEAETIEEAEVEEVSTEAEDIDTPEEQVDESDTSEDEPPMPEPERKPVVEVNIAPNMTKEDLVALVKRLDKVFEGSPDMKWLQEWRSKNADKIDTLPTKTKGRVWASFDRQVAEHAKNQGKEKV